jgi:adenylate kinase
MGGPAALTGTPGTGKSTVAAALRPGLRVVELAALARSLGAARGSGRSTTVDLRRIARRMRRGPPLPVDVIVGHLAHLLPVDRVVVLRCHPVLLETRLRRAHRGSAADRYANFVAEATDVVLAEALRAGARVWEVDTTRRSVARVADEVRRRLRTRGRSRFGQVDWLSDPGVTAHLLDEGR